MRVLLIKSVSQSKNEGAIVDFHFCKMTLLATLCAAAINFLALLDQGTSSTMPETQRIDVG